MLNDKKATNILPCPSPIWNPKVKHKKDEPQTTIFSYGIGFKQPDQKTQMIEGKNASEPDSHAEVAPLQMAE